MGPQMEHAKRNTNVISLSQQWCVFAFASFNSKLRTRNNSPSLDTVGFMLTNHERALIILV